MYQRTLKDVENKANELIDQEFTFTVFGQRQTVCARTLGYKFEFDGAKRRFGACHYRTKKITLSRPVCEVNLDKLETKITDTILHELAHAFSVHFYGSEGKGHGSLWKNIAWAIGCDGNRCYDGNKINQPKSKYTLVCPNGCEYPRHKKTRKSGYVSQSCGNCSGGYYNPQFKLTLVQNY